MDYLFIEHINKIRKHMDLDPIMEEILLHEIHGLEFKDFFSQYAESEAGFTQHIYDSIPGYKETEKITADILVNMYKDGGIFLDIGASEGTWGKYVSYKSNGRIITHNLDPNESMEQKFKKSDVTGAKFIRKAFGDGFDDVEGYNPEGVYDVVRESMVFQFISTDRKTQYGMAKKALKPNGLFITQSKNFLPDQKEYERFEKLKDIYKSKSFSQEEIEKKAKEVLPNMSRYMVQLNKTMNALKSHFSNAYQYWVSGNFHGFIASNDNNKINQFMRALPNEFPETVEGKIIPPETAAKSKYK